MPITEADVDQAIVAAGKRSGLHFAPASRARINSEGRVKLEEISLADFQKSCIIQFHAMTQFHRAQIQTRAKFPKKIKPPPFDRSIFQQAHILNRQLFLTLIWYARLPGMEKAERWQRAFDDFGAALDEMEAYLAHPVLQSEGLDSPPLTAFADWITGLARLWRAAGGRPSAERRREIDGKRQRSSPFLRFAWALYEHVPKIQRIGDRDTFGAKVAYVLDVDAAKHQQRPRKNR